MNDGKPTARTSDIVVLDLEEETLVYDLVSSTGHCLNETAGFVWRQCDGQRTVPEILKLVEAQYGGSASEDFVWLALDQLSENKLLVETDIRSATTSSRREMLKRVGIATVVAVPIVASLVTPSSALAASSCGCVNPGACITQTMYPNTSNCNGSGLCAP